MAGDAISYKGALAAKKPRPLTKIPASLLTVIDLAGKRPALKDSGSVTRVTEFLECGIAVRRSAFSSPSAEGQGPVLPRPRVLQALREPPGEGGTGLSTLRATPSSNATSAEVPRETSKPGQPAMTPVVQDAFSLLGWVW